VDGPYAVSTSEEYWVFQSNEPITGTEDFIKDPDGHNYLLLANQESACFLYEKFDLDRVGTTRTLFDNTEANYLQLNRLDNGYALNTNIPEEEIEERAVNYCRKQAAARAFVYTERSQVPILSYSKSVLMLAETDCGLLGCVGDKQELEDSSFEAFKTSYDSLPFLVE